MLSYLLSILFLIAGSDTETIINSYLDNELSDYTKYEYEVLRMPRYVDSLNDENIKIDEARRIKINKGFASIPVVITLKNNRTKKTYISLKLKLYDEVLIANQKIEKGEELDKSLFETQELEVTKFRSKHINNIKKLNHFRASRTINEKDVLQEKFVESIPLIQYW